MTHQPIIRRTNASDLTAIAAIAEETGLFPAEALGGMIAGFLDGSAPDIWLTAECEGQTLGFGFCEPERFTNGTWNLLAIATSPAFQGRGIGAALLRHLEDLLRREGQRILIVETIGTEDYARTQRFYVAQGYVEEARIRGFWDAGADKLTFWKQL